jgi:hypothetical protein
MVPDGRVFSCDVTATSREVVKNSSPKYSSPTNTFLFHLLRVKTTWATRSYTCLQSQSKCYSNNGNGQRIALENLQSDDSVWNSLPQIEQLQ